MRGFLGCLVVAFIAYAFKWNWAAMIFVLAAIGNLVPNNKKKKPTKSTKNKIPHLREDDLHPDDNPLLLASQL